MRAKDVLKRYIDEDLPEFVERTWTDVNQRGNFGNTPLHVACTRGELKENLQSSQSRVAKMEAADLSGSLDLLIRSLITPGGSDRELSRITTPRALITARTRVTSFR
jgi:hypothetical protein